MRTSFEKQVSKVFIGSSVTCVACARRRTPSYRRTIRGGSSRGVVFLGDQVTNQYFETAAFAGLGNSPATLEGARMADFYGCCRGNSSQQADANQASVQADTRGDPCWISLPIDAVVNKDAWCQYRQPVVRLREALCGHPGSVTWWD
jgi:hypothetical protein